jgi:hypothetical protein
LFALLQHDWSKEQAIPKCKEQNGGEGDPQAPDFSIQIIQTQIQKSGLYSSISHADSFPSLSTRSVPLKSLKAERRIAKDGMRS